MITLREDIHKCAKCPNVLHPCVPPIIKPDADVMFIARNPGRKEYQLQSEPFERTSTLGRVIDRQLTRIGLLRDSVWITNLVLGYTQDDREPTIQEIENCLPYLIQQLLLIRPKVIVTIGKHASEQVLGPHYRWKRDHGSLACVQLGAIRSMVVPITHPGQAVRGMYHEFEDDFDVIKSVL